jgi:hypothetical protein
VAKLRVCLDTVGDVLGQPALRVMTQLVMAGVCGREASWRGLGAWVDRCGRGLWSVDAHQGVLLCNVLLAGKLVFVQKCKSVCAGMDTGLHNTSCE